MDIRQPDEYDLLRDHGWVDDEATFATELGICVPIPSYVEPTLLSSSGLPLGVIGKPQLRVKPAWHRHAHPITGDVAWVLCFDCADHR